MNKQIFSKIAKIGEEVRASNIIKVELGVQEDLKSFINLLDQKSSYLPRLATTANEKINEYNSLAKELENHYTAQFSKLVVPNGPQGQGLVGANGLKLSN